MPIFGPPNVDKLKARRNVKGLIKAMNAKDPDVRAAASKALKELVGTLLGDLYARNSSARRAAAMALVRTYKSGRLDDADKERILHRRAVITQKHIDRSNSHQDRYQSSDCESHMDSSHDDSGIGVDFPL